MMNDAFRYAHLEVVGSQGDGPPLCALVGSGGRDEVRLLDMRGAHERFRHCHPPQGGGARLERCGGRGLFRRLWGEAQGVVDRWGWNWGGKV